MNVNALLSLMASHTYLSGWNHVQLRITFTKLLDFKTLLLMYIRYIRYNSQIFVHEEELSKFINQTDQLPSWDGWTWQVYKECRKWWYFYSFYSQQSIKYIPCTKVQYMDKKWIIFQTIEDGSAEDAGIFFIKMTHHYKHDITKLDGWLYTCHWPSKRVFGPCVTDNITTN